MLESTTGAEQNKRYLQRLSLCDDFLEGTQEFSK